EPARPVVAPRLGHPTAAISCLELVAPVGHAEWSGRHAELEDLARVALDDGAGGRPAPEPVAVVALEDRAESGAGGALLPRAAGVLGGPLPHPGQVGHERPH